MSSLPESEVPRAKNVSDIIVEEPTRKKKRTSRKFVDKKAKKDKKKRLN